MNIKDTSLLQIDSIDINSDIALQNIVFITNIVMENSSVTFLHLASFYGSTSAMKYILFDQITLQNTIFENYNDLIIFGPLYTQDDIDIHFNDWIFDNLHFKNLANILHLRQQTLDSFNIENCTFTNLIGGRILVEPLTISTTSVFSQLSLANITVSNNDFRDSTFIVLKEHCRLQIQYCNIFKNSGNFRGTVLSITDK